MHTYQDKKYNVEPHLLERLPHYLITQGDIAGLLQHLAGHRCPCRDRFLTYKQHTSIHK